MATVREILIKVFTRSDNKAAQKTEKVIKKVGEESAKAAKKGDKGFKSFGDTLKGMPARAAAVGVALFALTKSIGAAVKLAVQFRISMARAWTIASRSNVADLTADILALSAQLGIAEKELAEGLYQTLSKGVPEPNGITFLSIAAKIAIADGTKVTTVVDGLTTVLNAFQLQADEAQRIADILFKTVAKGGTTFAELASSISQVAPIAAASGISIEEIAAAVVTLTKQGEPTASTMTKLRAAIIGLNKALGDGFAETMSFQEAVGEVSKQAKGSQTQLLKMLGSIEAVQAVLFLTGKNAEGASKALEDMADVAGEAEGAFGKVQNFREWQLLGQALKVIVVSLGTSINESLKPAIRKITEILNFFIKPLLWLNRNLPETTNKIEKLSGSLTKADSSATAASKSTGKFREELQGVATTSLEGTLIGLEKISGKLEDVKKRAGEARLALNALDEAEAGIQAAQIDVRVARGEISKEEGALQKVDIREKAQVRRLARTFEESRAIREPSARELEEAEAKEAGALKTLSQRRAFLRGRPEAPFRQAGVEEAKAVAAEATSERVSAEKVRDKIRKEEEFRVTLLEKARVRESLLNEAEKVTIKNRQKEALFSEKRRVRDEQISRKLETAGPGGARKLIVEQMRRDIKVLQEEARTDPARAAVLGQDITARRGEARESFQEVLRTRARTGIEAQIQTGQVAAAAARQRVGDLPQGQRAGAERTARALEQQVQRAELALENIENAMLVFVDGVIKLSKKAADTAGQVKNLPL